MGTDIHVHLQPHCLAMAYSQLALDPSSAPREETYNPENRYTHPKLVSMISLETNVLGSPRFLPAPLQIADMYARHVLSPRKHPQRPLARPTTLPDHSHPHKAQMPPPLTRRCQAPAHPPGAHNPTCKEPVHPPPRSPCHPHGQVRLHSRRGRRHVGVEGARAHPRATLQDGQGVQGGMGGVVDATSLLGQACCLRPFHTRESAVNVAHRAPHGRASPKPRSPPPSGARSRPPQGLWREAGRVGYLKSPWRRRRRL